MPDKAKMSLQQELLTLQWREKDSVSSMKEFIADAKRIVRRHLERTGLLERTLQDLVDRNGLTDAIVLKNLPMDPIVPATPTDGSVTLNKPTFVAEAILLAVGELGGTHTFGYKSEKHYSNPWVHEGFPRQGKVSALTATDQVPHHQDMSYQTLIPDLLGLICVREGQDDNVQTTLLDPAAVADHLPKDVVATLRQPLFQIAAPLEWVDTQDIDLTTLRPVLEGRSLHLPVDWNNMVGVDDEARRATDLLKEALQEVEPVGIHLQDGMMVLFNNQKVVHARTPYRQVRFDGTDRVIYRSYFSKNLGQVEQETRII
jgi:L-asparagine oxygenase